MPGESDVRPAFGHPPPLTHHPPSEAAASGRQAGFEEREQNRGGPMPMRGGVCGWGGGCTVGATTGFLRIELCSESL
jgi:hypothetical protein